MTNPAMTNPAPLDPHALADALRALPAWALEEGALVRRLDLGDFRRAIAFLVRIAFDAEALAHHPEIESVYGRLTLRLRTHDAGDRVTALDVKLAHAIERALAERLSILGA